MFKRIVLSAAFVGLFCFAASDAMAGHGHRGNGWGHGGGWGHTAHVGHGYQWHGNHVDHVDAYYHNGHIDTVRHHGRPLYYNSFYGGGWGGGYGGFGYGGYGCGRSGVSVRFGW